MSVLKVCLRWLRGKVKLMSTRRPTRRPLARLGSALALALLVLSACAPPGQDDGDGGGEAGADTSDTPVSVGFIAGLTGTAAAPASDMRNGFELFWEQENHEVAGREVELFVEDDEGEPDVGLSAARRLVEQENVDVVVGPHFAHVGLAVGEYLETVETPMIYPIPASEEFLLDPVDTMFLAGGTAAQYTHPLGKWAAQEAGLSAATISSDYTFGHEIAAGFAATFTDYGGEIENQMWPPLGTTDYGPFASEIAEGDYDVVFNGLQADDAVVFQEAWADYGLNEDGPTLVSSPSTMDQSLVRTMKETADGAISSGHFAEGRGEGDTADFVEAYEEANGEIPGYYAASGYFGAQLVAAALEELDGEIPDANAFIDAAGAVDLDDSVFGPATVDENGNLVLDVYMRQVKQRDDGAYWNTVDDVVEQVSPEFEYDYDAYLDKGAYSRDMQGTDWPESCDAYADDAECPLE